jgi:uridine kinase
MKIAILMAGYLRGMKENLSNFKKNILQENDCDIYIHYTEKKYDDKYNNENINIDFLIKELNPKLIVCSKNIKFNYNEKINNLLNQNYKYYWLNEEMNKISKIEKINYDIILKIRPDIYINSKLNYNLDSSYLYIPSDSKIDLKKLKNANNEYICDMIAFGNKNLMNNYFNFYNELNKLIEDYGLVNETLLKKYLDKNNIKYKLIDIEYIVILSNCNIIAISGDSGSGKSTLAKILKNIFTDSFLLECDRYHKWDRTSKYWEKFTPLNTESNYITKMENDIFNLKFGKDIYQINYDHNTGKFTDKEYIESKDNLIVCGLHTLNISSNILNLRIFLDTDINLKYPWKIKRDIIKRGYNKETVYQNILKRKNDFINYILPQKKNSDIIINMYTDYIFNIDTFKIDDVINIFYRIGIKKDFNLNKVNFLFSNNKKIFEDDYLYIYFDKDISINKIINLIINNI